MISAWHSIDWFIPPGLFEGRLREGHLGSNGYQACTAQLEEQEVHTKLEPELPGQPGLRWRWETACSASSLSLIFTGTLRREPFWEIEDWKYVESLDWIPSCSLFTLYKLRCWRISSLVLALEDSSEQHGSHHYGGTVMCMNRYGTISWDMTVGIWWLLSELIQSVMDTMRQIKLVATNLASIKKIYIYVNYTRKTALGWLNILVGWTAGVIVGG